MPNILNYQLIKNVVIRKLFVQCTSILCRTLHVIVYVIYAFKMRLFDGRQNITSDANEMGNDIISQWADH
jgi:hypothetical protein